MGDVFQSILTATFIVEFIMGTLGNGFIVLVNFVDWVKRRTISAVDPLLTALAISRIVLFGVGFMDWWLFAFHPALLMTRSTLITIYSAWTMSNHFSVWLATCLSIFYFLKIANFSNSLFLYFKWRLRKVISMTLLLSLVLLFSNCVILKVNIQIWIDESKRNLSASICGLKKFSQITTIFLMPNFISTLVPFTMSLVAFLLLTFSLWRHLKNMQHEAGGSRDASTTAHTKALQMVIAFILLYMIFFLTLAVESWTFEMEKILITLMIKTTVIAFPVCHTYMLILGNNKLRRALFNLAQWLKSSSKDVET